jgi:hypothetical protein
VPFDRGDIFGHARRGLQYDGIAEVWADSVDEVKRALAEPRYLEVIRPDEYKFLDLANCVFMVTEEVPMKG